MRGNKEYYQYEDFLDDKNWFYFFKLFCNWVAREDSPPIRKNFLHLLTYPIFKMYLEAYKDVIKIFMLNIIVIIMLILDINL